MCVGGVRAEHVFGETHCICLGMGSRTPKTKLWCGLWACVLACMGTLRHKH